MASVDKKAAEFIRDTLASKTFRPYITDDVIGRVHRPVGLNIGSRTPAEIAVATLAGLIADRNGRPGGFSF